MNASSICEATKAEDKPSSVHPGNAGQQSSILAVGYPDGSSGLPWNSNGANQLLFPYLALLRAGFAHWSISELSRGLLHRDFTLTPDQVEGGIVSVALSVGSLRPGVTGRPDSLEFGLSSL